MSKQWGVLEGVYLVLFLSSYPFEGQGKNIWNAVESWRDYGHYHRTRCDTPFVELKRVNEIHLGKRHLVHNGTRLIDRGASSKGLTTIGVISSLQDGNTVTRENVWRFIEEFEEANADWIVVNGDIGYTKEDIIENLKPFVRVNIPVLVLIGNEEPILAFNEALAHLKEENANIFNLNFTRYIETPNLIMVSLPGHYSREESLASGGCLYSNQSVRRFEQLIKKGHDKSIVLLSHGAPRGVGASAVDWGPDSGNQGDPEMRRAMARMGVQFGIFAHVIESGGKGTDLKYRSVSMGTWSESLLLNAGSASAIPRRLQNGNVSQGMAMVVVFDAKNAKYEVIHPGVESFFSWNSVR